MRPPSPRAGSILLPHEDEGEKEGEEEGRRMKKDQLSPRPWIGHFP